MSDTSASGASTGAIPSVDFTTIVLSLRHGALAALGLLEESEGHDVGMDLGAARLQIDMLDVLREKTKGNLTDDEERLVTSVLAELRLAWVQGARK